MRLTQWFLPDGAPLAIWLARLVASVAVTLHVLLRKREVRSSISWIGLAWIAPLLGLVCYVLFGVNRVRRRARQLRRPGNRAQEDAAIPESPGWDGHLASLEQAGRRISRRPALAGSAFRLLRCGDEAYPLMTAAIASAERSVALSSYLLRDDAAGGPLLAALIAAHGRGVAVRVIVDGIGSGYFVSGAYRRLRRAGVPAARFMHSLLPWRMPFINLRTHTKVLVVDGTRAFTGGMNIGAENVLARHPKHPVRDTHFEVTGPVVMQLLEAFGADWQFVAHEPIDGPDWYPPLAPAGEAVARVITSGPDEDLEKIEFHMLEAIACARESIAIATPYFLPDTQFENALALAAMRGVQVDIAIPVRSNQRLVDWATRAHVGPMLSEGVRLWLNPPPFDHSKIMVVDGVWSMIGSANLDMRSLRLNFELNTEIYDADLARLLTAEIVARQGRRLHARDLRQRPMPRKLRDAAARLMQPYL